MTARVAAVSAMLLALAAPAAQSQKSIVVTVLDQSGVPVKDVSAADLAVQENGTMREVVDVKPDTDPMTIAVLVDNAKATMGKEAPTREMRAALTAFVQKIQQASPETTIGLWECSGAGVMIQKPTAKTDDLTKRISRMVPGQQSGGVMLEALSDASKEVSKKGTNPRRVIVAVSLDSPEMSTMLPQDVANAMQKAGVNFWAVSIASYADANTSSQGNSGVREIILSNITAASGGAKFTGVTPISLDQQLTKVAEALLSQHIVTYARPADAPAVVSTVQAVSKKGMKALTAPWVQ
jgi:von Willebrand factor type A domain